ncbi:hypothetical protein [Pseudaquabacterium terrae]|uniref:hypothetical protein n=1 Tax=Pseudaquabacterium terrae TaxID=2732868 RepID=UPI001FE44019|nr:hypothetical protein [Aquabacterium terrae]
MFFNQRQRGAVRVGRRLDQRRQHADARIQPDQLCDLDQQRIVGLCAHLREQRIVDVPPQHQRIDELEQHVRLRRPQRRIRLRAPRIRDLRVRETHAPRDRADMQLPLVVVAPGHAGAQDQRLAQGARQHAAIQQAGGSEQAAVDEVLEQAFVARDGSEQHRRRHAGRQQAGEAVGERGGVGCGDGGDAVHREFLGRCATKSVALPMLQ